MAELPARLAAACGARAASLVPVVNATGVVVHTNLGRSRLPPEAVAQVARIATSYSNLEFDLAAASAGARGACGDAAARPVGAEAGVVVNNNAAAVLLAVNTFAEGREVVVSRGELVEIGGSFRIPDMLRKVGARLREVGTTNRTRSPTTAPPSGPDTGLVLKVHPSNFRIVGFTEAPSRRGACRAWPQEAGVPMVEDLGSGLLAPLAGLDETTVAESLRAGVNVVTFSGDKLLGGPQAGLVVGARGPRRRDAPEPPLSRAARDKMTLAALDAVLVIHESGRAAMDLPTARMLSASVGEVRGARDRLRRAPGRGGAARPSPSPRGPPPPAAAPPPPRRSRRCCCAWPIARRAPSNWRRRCARGEPPVVARVADDALVLDLRTVATEEEDALAEALVRVATTANGDRSTRLAE